MNINEAKEVLETVDYPVSGHDWDDVIKELHEDYRVTAVGGTMNTLGDAAPLFMRSGNVAHMVDNKDDLFRACVRIKQVAKAREGAKTVVIESDALSRYIPEIKRSVDMEVDLAFRHNRVLPTVDNEYTVIYDAESRTQTRKGAQIIDDLLSDDKALNDKAVKALKEILLIKRHESVTQ